MEIIKAEFSKEFYDSLNPDQRKEIIIRSVETGDYKEDPEWAELKEASNKAFRALRKKEFQLRESLKIN
jgi:TRAP-type C4-dicarboxylate transport system substrate-binding protein